MIPKIIHYIWFGPNPLPEKVKECIKSWHKYLPEYKIMLWNEETFNIDSACTFVKDAYKYGKYAFVSDYVRLWALKKYGGIYLDTDMEVIRPIPEEILANRVVLGTDDSGYLMALMMSEPEHPYIAQCLEHYHHLKFVLDGGKFNMEVINTYLQNILGEYGYIIANKKQSLRDGIEIYPDDYFSVRSLSTGKLNLTPNSIVIHWHTILWASTKTRVINFLRINILIPVLGRKLYSIVASKVKNGKTTL